MDKKKPFAHGRLPCKAREVVKWLTFRQEVTKLTTPQLDILLDNVVNLHASFGR